MNDRMRDDPAAYWNEDAGPVWVAQQEALDRMMGPITETLLSKAAAAEGETVIDVGCGCGETTVELARAVGPSGRVLGVDVSEPMLARAAERASGLPVEFVLGDATTYEFEPGRADLMISRFGVMFFPEPTRAFTNLRRALVPQVGRLAFVAWQAPDQNPWLRTAMAALPEYAAGAATPPIDQPGPFGLATRGRAEKILIDAGFREVTLSRREATLPMGDTPEEVAQVTTQVGALGRLLATVDALEQVRLRNRVERYLDKVWGTDLARFESAYWLVEASA